MHKATQERRAEHDKLMDSLAGYVVTSIDPSAPIKADVSLAGSLARTERTMIKMFDASFEALALEGQAILDDLKRCIAVPQLVRGPDSQVAKCQHVLQYLYEHLASQISFCRHLHQAHGFTVAAHRAWSSRRRDRNEAASLIDSALSEKALADVEPLPIQFIDRDKHIEAALSLLEAQLGPRPRSKKARIK